MTLPPYVHFPLLRTSELRSSLSKFDIVLYAIASVFMCAVVFPSLRESSQPIIATIITYVACIIGLWLSMLAIFVCRNLAVRLTGVYLREPTASVIGVNIIDATTDEIKKYHLIPTTTGVWQKSIWKGLTSPGQRVRYVIALVLRYVFLLLLLLLLAPLYIWLTLKVLALL